MKKRVSVFILLMIMLVGVFGSVSVYASEIDFSQAQFNSISAMNTYEGDSRYPVESNGVRVCSNAWLNSITVDDYCILGFKTRERGHIVYLLISDKSFKANITFNYIHSGVDTEHRRSWYDGFKYTISGNSATFQNTVERTSSSCNGMYYCLFMSTGSFQGSSDQLGTMGSGYVVDCSGYELDEDGVPNNAKIANYLITEILGNYGNDLSQAPNLSIDEYVEPKEPVYNSDLGYLQNIACTTLVKKDNANNDNTANEYAGEKKYKFSYGLTTTSGFDLRSDGANVEYCIKIKGGYTTLLNDYVSLPTVVSDYYKVGHGVSYYYIDADLLNELYGQFRTDASLWAKTINSQIIIYMRPILESNSGFYYGGWSRIKFDKGNIQVDELSIDNGTTPDGEVSSEADGEEDDFVVENTTEGDSSYGEGSDFEDAESNASNVNTNTSNSDVSAEQMFQSIESLISQIGEIPQLIAVLFSFLPPWCLALFGVGFGLIVLLILYKLVRG